MQACDLPGGWIYVFLTSQDYNRCKIGRTSGDPLIRYKNERTSDPFLGFHVAFFVPSHLGAVSTLETLLKNEFRSSMIRNHDEGESEWYRLDYSTAEAIVAAKLEEWCDSKMHYFSGLSTDKMCRLYESDIRDCFRWSKDENDPFF